MEGRSMDERVNTTIGLLGELVSFESVSQTPNLDIVDHVRAYLDHFGIESLLSYDEAGDKANLLATIGPEVEGGIVLSGHTDVVPADPADWDTPPFTLVNRDGLLHGRGAVDMKGFIACVLAAVPEFAEAQLTRPVHIALSFDEETGSRGARILVDQMKALSLKPSIAIVGEPTLMHIVAGHKGGYEMTTTVTGLEGHASDPGRGVNAIFYAARMIAHIEDVGRHLAEEYWDTPFEPPHSTVSVGSINGGYARNVIPGSCSFDWELRPVPQQDGEEVLARIEEWVRGELLPQMHAVDPMADVTTVLDAAYPGLRYDPDSEAVALLKELTGVNATEVVSFGSDAGHFQRAGISTVLFGPGSIEQAHKPNEFISIHQIEACHHFLDRLKTWMST
jgi:acetylornithine deacetylase